MRRNTGFQDVAIIGGGPAGAVLGCYLKRAGVSRVRIVADKKRPELVVGESLIPAAMPILQDIGVEAKVRSSCCHKPGASITLFPDNDEWSLDFASISDAPATYAYNVDRSFFDTLLLERAIDLGCEVVRERASVLVCDDALYLKGQAQPELIVDASGRNREIARALGISALQGGRNDVALFAHLPNAVLPYGGSIHMTVLDCGWTWRIPLTGKVSVGIVAPISYFNHFGTSPAAQYDAILEFEPRLTPYLCSKSRLTPVASYTNYQRVSQQFFGSNWVQVGDAAGFADPVFSSGVFLSLFGARELAAQITSPQPDFSRYASIVRSEIERWQTLIRAFYDGSFFGLIRSAPVRSIEYPTMYCEVERALGLLIAGFGSVYPECTSILKTALSYEASSKGQLYELRVG